MRIWGRLINQAILLMSSNGGLLSKPLNSHNRATGKLFSDLAINEDDCGGSKLCDQSNFDTWRPLLMVPPLFDDSGNVLNKFHRLENKQEMISWAKQRSGDDIKQVEVVGMSHSWLALYNRVSHDMYILNPINGKQIKLPSLRTLPDPEVTLRGGVSRVVLDYSPVTYIRWFAWTHLRAMMIYDRGTRLAFCVPGHSKAWTPISDRDSSIRVEREYEDVAYSTDAKQFYCLTKNPTELVGWDVRNCQSPFGFKASDAKWLNFDRPDFCWPSRSRQDLELKNKCWQIKYIAFDEWYPGRVYFVVRHVMPDRPYKTIDFDVYRNIRESGFRYMKASLDGVTIFVGNNTSFAVPRYYTRESAMNCIYFTDDSRLTRLSGSVGGHDNGIFDYKNNTFSTCCGKADCPLDNPHKKKYDPAPLWFY